MAAFPLPATWASCQPHFGVVPRQRHTTWRTAFCLAFLHCLLQQKPCPNNWTVRAITRAVIGQLLWQSYSWKVIPQIPNWTLTTPIPEDFLEIFLRERESEPRRGNESRETPTPTVLRFWIFYRKGAIQIINVIVTTTFWTCELSERDFAT